MCKISKHFREQIKVWPGPCANIIYDLYEVSVKVKVKYRHDLAHTCMNIYDMNLFAHYEYWYSRCIVLKHSEFQL
jgi:hypothetical protein